MDLAGFIDTYREAIAKRVVESTRPSTGPRRTATPSPSCCASPSGRRGMPSKAQPSHYRPTGARP